MHYTWAACVTRNPFFTHTFFNFTNDKLIVTKDRKKKQKMTLYPLNSKLKSKEKILLQHPQSTTKVVLRRRRHQRNKIVDY